MADARAGDWFTCTWPPAPRSGGVELAIWFIAHSAHSLLANLICSDRGGDHDLWCDREWLVSEKPHLGRTGHDSGEIVFLRRLEADMAQMRGQPHRATKLGQPLRIGVTLLQRQVRHEPGRDHFAMQEVRMQSRQYRQTLRYRVRSRDTRAFETDAAQ